LKTTVAMIVVAVEIHAFVAAWASSYGAATFTFDADVGAFARIAAVATIIDVRSQVDAKLVAFGQFWRATAHLVVTNLVVGTGRTALPAVAGIRVKVDAAFVALREILQTFAGAFGANGIVTA
jgi:hypothetical protein